MLLLLIATIIITHVLQKQQALFVRATVLQQFISFARLEHLNIDVFLLRLQLLEAFLEIRYLLQLLVVQSLLIFELFLELSYFRLVSRER